jgi:hypothetical protein
MRRIVWYQRTDRVEVDGIVRGMAQGGAVPLLPRLFDGMRVRPRSQW